jgi:hypothetical protein
MKYQSIACFTNTLLVLAAFAVFCPTALAQDVGVTAHDYQAGKYVDLTVSFSGDGSAEIRTVYAYLNLASPLLANQQGFDPNFNAGTSTRTPDGFKIRIPLSQTAATGDYGLSIVASFPKGSATYVAEKDFHFPVHVVNGDRAPRPNITVKP